MKKILYILLLFSLGASAQQNPYIINNPHVIITGDLKVQAAPTRVTGSQQVLVRDSISGLYKYIRSSDIAGGGGGAVSSVFSRTGAVTALSTDYNSFYPLLSGSYVNPSWISSLPFSKITGVPPILKPTNGLQTISPDSVGLGGTLTTNSIINSHGKYLAIVDLVSGNLVNFFSGVSGDNSIVQLGASSSTWHTLLNLNYASSSTNGGVVLNRQRISDNAFQGLYMGVASNGVINNKMLIVDQANHKGLENDSVATDTSKYSTWSLVNKQWVLNRIHNYGGGGGSGSVTTVSIVTANGVSGSVANATTTPAITLSLGAITPTSTNGVSAATMAFNDATSSIQTQLNAKGVGTVTSFSKTDGWGVISSVTNPTTTPNHTIRVDTAHTTNGVMTFKAGATKAHVDSLNIVFGTDFTGLGTSGSPLATSNSGVIAKVLTGYVSGAGTVSATDNILQAIQKLNGNIGALVTGVSSFNTRTGAVIPVAGDYATLTETYTNKNLTSGTNTFPTFNQNTTGSAAKWTTARNLAGNSVDGSANVAFSNKFIVQGTTDAGLSGSQFLGALATGIVKNTTTTGVLSIAAAGTDYQAPITLTTTGTSGAAAFVSNTLNIPQYAGATFANPTASVGLTAINGSATTAMRSDAAPALDQTIIPTMTGVWTFQKNAIATTVTDAVILANNTAATSGATIQSPPALDFTGRAWNTTATAASNRVDGKLQYRLVSSSAPFGTLYFSDATSATTSQGTFVDRASIDGSGYTQITGNITTLNGNLVGNNSFSAVTLGGSNLLYTAGDANTYYNVRQSTGSHIWRASNGSTQLAALNESAVFAIGVAGTTLGSTSLAGNTSGVVSIKPQAAAGTYNFNIPITAGTAGQVLTSQAGGSTAMTWSSVPIMQATADLTAQTSAGNITTFTVGATTATFLISAYLNITAVVTDVIETQVTYTDENNTSQTANFFTQGATSALLSTISNSVYPTMSIRAKNATVITVKTTLTTGAGSITFDAGARIIQQ